VSRGDSGRAAGRRRGLRERRQRRSELAEGVSVEEVDGGELSQLGNGLDDEGSAGSKGGNKAEERTAWYAGTPYHRSMVPHVSIFAS